MSNQPAVLPDWADDAWTSKSGDTYYVQTEDRAVTMRTAGAPGEARLVGYITWGGYTPTIGNISVKKPYRRQGVATELFNRARQIEPDLDHSWDRLSNDAEAWISGMKAN